MINLRNLKLKGMQKIVKDEDPKESREIEKDDLHGVPDQETLTEALQGGLGT